jgi:hypothetical protein
MNLKLRVNGDKNIKHKTIKAKVGITDKKNQKVFFLEGGAFITPAEECEDFPEIMNNIESTCRRSIKNKLIGHNAISNDFLMNFEVCSDRMKKDKKTYLSFQYHFKQKNENNISIVTLKEKNEDFFISLLDDIENELSQYNMIVSKTR